MPLKEGCSSESNIWLSYTIKKTLRHLIIFFISQLDHDVCSNYGNWNYAAGIGNDPREDRKFNMVKQAMDYDPQVRYKYSCN